jgi:hypothetical protein
VHVHIAIWFETAKSHCGLFNICLVIPLKLESIAFNLKLRRHRYAVLVVDLFLLLMDLGGHPKPAICGHLKTGHMRAA